MIGSFRDRYGLAEGAVTDRETALAEELARTESATEEWVARVPRRDVRTAVQGGR
ncbi:hypothetical protein [Streptomyces sp. BBFR102]|uniref:hypothetical protein n=1 Tax=Streptomyces sp. BBFR102 TaxID=3448171 RepID=UPI003F533896